jgi:hypothetical protein
MSYEILNDDLFKDDDTSSKPSPKKKKGFKFEGIYIHFIILVLILIPVFLYFNGNFDNFFNNPNSNYFEVTLVGEVNNLSINYNGSLFIEAKKSSITTEGVSYYGENEEYNITNFNGLIYLRNKSLIFYGTAKNITFGKNKLILNDKNFKLNTSVKVEFNLNLSKINYEFKDGKLIIADKLNYNFDNSSVYLENFSTRVSYDGIFTFTGYPMYLKLSSLNNHLNVDFRNFKISNKDENLTNKK